MSRFALVAFCVAAAIAGANSANSNLSFGMTMATRAYTAVCWYEALKIFPETHSKDYGKCGGAAANIQKQVDEPNDQNREYFESDPEGETKFFGDTFLGQKTMEKLSNPKPYKSCERYLKELDGINADAPADESDAVRDSGNKKYPYRAFAYCMLRALRDTRGDAAIEAVKSERTTAKKHWMTTLLDRENEFRKRHGSDALKLNNELSAAAQKWAETNAKACKMYHSKNTDADRQWRGDGTGESLSSGSGDDEKEIAAYMAADGWYEEIKDYPYPEGYQGGDDELFHKIGHFTQSVWKGSQYVGYGYAYNKDCPKGKMRRFVAARYFPAGNMEGAYPANVAPPKK